MVIRNILVVALLLVYFCGYSQSRRFRHLTSADGISQSEVYSFLEDSRGFIWFGTVDGLNRYDGYNIEIFNTRKNDPHALSNNTIRSLAEDRLGRIWIGTDAGLNLFDPETELFHQIEFETSENKLSVWSLLVYEKQLFVGTNNGLWRTNIQSNNIKEIKTGFEEITEYKHSGQTVRSVFKSKKGGIWVSTPNNISKIIFQHGSNEPVEIEDFSFHGFSPAVSSIEDFSGNIWIAFGRDGLLRYNPETKQSHHFNKYGTAIGPASKKCSALALDKNGNLWVGTLDQGLNFVKKENLDKAEVFFETVQNRPFFSCSLNSNLIYSLYVSKENLLWVGTIGSGVNIYNPKQKKFTHYKFRDLTSETPNSNFIRSVYVDNRNRIWTGTHNNGLFLFDRKSEQFQKLGFETQSVFYIANYKENKYFICTSTGLHLVKLINNKLEAISSINSNQAVFNVVISKPGICWYAAINGLVRAKIIDDKITVDERYTINTTPRISTNNCRVLYYDESNNQILTGTEGGGLNVVSLDENHFPQKIDVYKKTENSGSISNNYVRSIIKDKEENTWIGTYEGLNKMIRDSSGLLSFQSFTKKDGLPNNMIQLIVEDNNHCLWIGTNGGLSQFIPEEKRFINYTASDGIQSKEFSEHTVFKKPDGEIIVGGINGINAFYPQQIEISTQTPQTNITEFYVFNKKVSPLEKVGRRAPLQKSIVLTDSIFLLPNQNNIGFDFSAMVYPNAEKVQYAYMLEGFDREWQYTDAEQRNANYTNLRHGDYTFKVKSTNNDGVWEEEPRTIFIHINTPFVLTWYAFVIYALVIILIFVYFSYYSVIRYTTKKRLLLEQEHNQKIHELDVMRTRFFINISHDLRTPLSLISGPLESILQNNQLNTDVKGKLHLIKRNVKRLSYLVEQLLDVRKAESGKLSPKVKSEDIVSFTKNELTHFNYAIKNKGLDLKVSNNPEKIIACFDPAMISKVYFNVISNAIKFTDKGKIEINIERVEKDSVEQLQNTSYTTFVKIEVKDTGKGISSEQKSRIFNRFYQDQTIEGKGYGIGLSHTKELIDAHHGFIEFESTEGIGTTLRFYLPDVKDIPESEKKNTSSTEDIYINEGPKVEIESTREKNAATSILVVEDNADMRNYIMSELKGTYNIIQAGDGAEALIKAQNKMPDLIVSDVMMPNMDGIVFCKEIKSNIKTSHIPVILLTAKVDKDTKYEGIETGADDYIPKPFEMEYLKIRITNLLQSRDLLRKRFQKSTVLEPSSVTVTTVDEKFLSKLIKVIEDGIPETDFTIGSLELQMGMSHANFYRKVKSLTGQSGQELLLNMRMKRAYQILSENKGLRIAEVAYMVGFTNPKYFSKCFKDNYGVAPSELIK